MKAESEKEIENQILDFLSMLTSVYAWKNNTTGVYDPRKKVFRKLKGHAIKGVSDILGVITLEIKGVKLGLKLAIEVKNVEGMKKHLRYIDPFYKPTNGTLKDYIHAQDQQDFLDRIENHGGVSGIFCSLESCQLFIFEKLDEIKEALGAA